LPFGAYMGISYKRRCRPLRSPASQCSPRATKTSTVRIPEPEVGLARSSGSACDDASSSRPGAETTGRSGSSSKPLSGPITRTWTPLPSARTFTWSCLLASPTTTATTAATRTYGAPTRTPWRPGDPSWPEKKSPATTEPAPASPTLRWPALADRHYAGESSLARTGAAQNCKPAMAITGYLLCSVACGRPEPHSPQPRRHSQAAPRLLRTYTPRSEVRSRQSRRLSVKPSAMRSETRQNPPGQESRLGRRARSAGCPS